MLEGGLDEELVFTATAVGVAVVRLIHPGLLRWVRAPAHLAELPSPPPTPTHSCFLGPAGHPTCRLGQGWAILAPSLPSCFTWWTALKLRDARSTEGRARLWACLGYLIHNISPPHRHAGHTQTRHHTERPPSLLSLS